MFLPQVGIMQNGHRFEAVNASFIEITGIGLRRGTFNHPLRLERAREPSTRVMHRDIGVAARVVEIRRSALRGYESARSSSNQISGEVAPKKRPRVCRLPEISSTRSPADAHMCPSS